MSLRGIWFTSGHMRREERRLLNIVKLSGGLELDNWYGDMSNILDGRTPIRTYSQIYKYIHSLRDLSFCLWHYEHHNTSFHHKFNLPLKCFTLISGDEDLCPYSRLDHFPTTQTTVHREENCIYINFLFLIIFIRSEKFSQILLKI